MQQSNLKNTDNTSYDIVIVGGGINGCGIARDAAGRGLKVLLLEQSDLASATSSASTKLFHGGLRYLETYEFSLVRKALIEREVLLQNMPHISWPLRFVLPHHSGLRPKWMLRAGLFLYDHLGGRKILPSSTRLNLRSDIAGERLKPAYKAGFEYSDCWVDDARLVVLNARDAAERGAEILTRTRFDGATYQDGKWQVSITDQQSGASSQLVTKALVNAAGPWVDDVLHQKIAEKSDASIRLVRGSHIVIKKHFEHDRAYIFQQDDGRIVFAIPYETDFTLIGTTDQDHEGDPAKAVCTDEERDYLIAAANGYFKEPVTVEDVVWRYSGVRPLYDDGTASASEATRDYVLALTDRDGHGPLLNIFGGKITTYRKLAEAAIEKLAPYFPNLSSSWTEKSPLPGGDFPVDGQPALVANLCAKYGFVDQKWALRLVRAYGTDAVKMLGDAQKIEDLGQNFGWNLTEREVLWLQQKEWAISADDVVWRRSKVGLRLSELEIKALDDWMQQP
jgi:glycerol-3-phosphate dehydrogenase